MRIGVVAPEFPPDIGGVETYGFEVARELARRGHDVSVLTVAHAQREISAAGINVIPTLKLKRHLDAAIVKNFQMDLWHATNAAYAWLALENKPVVVSVHGNDFIRPYILIEQPKLYSFPGLWRVPSWSKRCDVRLAQHAAYKLIERSLPQATHVIANSRYTEMALLQRFPTCRGRTSVGFVGVSENYFETKRPPRVPGSPLRLITVCRLADKRKNVDRVLQALATLRHYPFTYTVIGDGSQRPGLERLSADLGLSGRVEFLGFVDRMQLTERLAGSDLLVLASSVLPASHEGFGIVYLEANACGTPVLAARLAGAVEAVEEGVSGFFVEEPTVNAITAALERFLSAKIRFAADACRAFARRFTWGRVVDHVLSGCESRVCVSTRAKTASSCAS